MKVDRLDYYRNKLRGVPVADLGRAAWTILLDATTEAEADEREACAKLCNELANSGDISTHQAGCMDCESAIRARGGEMSGPTRDQVVEWAQEAGIALCLIPVAVRHQIDELERFAALAFNAGRASHAAEQPPAPMIVDMSHIDKEALTDGLKRARPVMMAAAPMSRREHIAALVSDPLTERKAADICDRDGYDVTGVVMTRVAKEGDDFTGVQRCIVNLGAVRWFFDSGAWQRTMFPENQPDRVSEAVAAEREECSRIFDEQGWIAADEYADAIRARGQA